MKAWLARRRKFLVAVATFAAGAVSAGFLHGTALTDVELGLLALNALGVHAVPNAKESS